MAPSDEAAWLLLTEAADFPMMRKCLLGIKRRAEASRPGEDSGIKRRAKASQVRGARR